jgi:tetratricopeptide (TPR) repeat protein
MRLRHPALLALVFLVMAPLAGAQPPAAQGSPLAKEPRRDPKGITGISPFWEALVKGDRATLARDFEAATQAYREAIAKEPRNPMGHYRLGQVEVLKGNLAEADAAYAAALRFAAEDPAMRARVLFVAADTKERLKAYDAALEGWRSYEAWLRANPSVKGFPLTAVDRQRRIEAYQQLLLDSAKVRARIEERVRAVTQGK